jgi:hypothetical protein
VSHGPPRRRLRAFTRSHTASLQSSSQARQLPFGPGTRRPWSSS